MRALSRDEISGWAGGVISEGVHHLQTHVPGRLDPDGSEIGTIRRGFVGHRQ